MGRDRTVHREPRRSQRQRDVERLFAGALHRAHQSSAEIVRGLDEVQRPLRERQRGIRQELEVARDVIGMPLLDDVRDARLGRRLHVEQRGEDLDTRRTVDQRVVQFRDERVVAVLESLDDPCLPQRAVTGQLAARDIGDERRELRFTARCRQCGAAEVEIEIEVGILDPDRVVQPERHFDDATPQRPDQVEPRRHDLADALVGEPARRGRRIDDRDAHDVHVGRWCLQREERGVETREALHGVLLQGAGGRNGRCTDAGIPGPGHQCPHGRFKP